MEKRKKKMTFVIGWILRIPRLEKIRARNQEALRVELFELQKEMNEFEAELWKYREHHQKRDVDNSLDVEKKEDPSEYQTCGTKEEDEEKNICEPKVEEDERKEEEHQDDTIFEPKVDQDDLKIAAMEDKCSALVGDQASEAVTCLFEDMGEESEDEDVKEVNFYELQDAEFEMSLKDIVDGLHEDHVSDIWYAKEDWYGVAKFIINPIRLDEDNSYTWIEFIAREYFQQQKLVPARCWKRRKKEIYQHRILVPAMCWRKRKKKIQQ